MYFDRLPIPHVLISAIKNLIWQLQICKSYVRADFISNFASISYLFIQFPRQTMDLRQTFNLLENISFIPMAISCQIYNFSLRNICDIYVCAFQLLESNFFFRLHRVHELICFSQSTFACCDFMPNCFNANTFLTNIRHCFRFGNLFL